MRPVLTRLDVPVRAVVAPFRDATMAAKVAAALQRHLLPLMVPAGVWLQDNGMYHSTLWHASHHLASQSSANFQLLPACCVSHANLALLPSNKPLCLWYQLKGSLT